MNSLRSNSTPSLLRTCQSSYGILSFQPPTIHFSISFYTLKAERFTNEGCFRRRVCMLYCIGCKLSDGEPESKKTWYIIDVSEFEKLKVFYFLKHLDKSVIVSFFDLSLTNTEIISQYRLTYTPHSGLNSLPLYEIERS